MKSLKRYEQEINQDAMKEIQSIVLVVPERIELIAQEVKDGEISGVRGLSRIKGLLKVWSEE